MLEIKEGFKLAYSCEEFGTNGLGVEIYVKYPGDLKKDFEKNYVFMHANETVMSELRRVQHINDATRQKNIADENAELLSCFDTPIYVEKIPNGYCSQSCCSDKPWFIVTTKIGRIKIGWRKRVIEIDWSGSDNKIQSKELFPNEQTTRFDNTIHAWSYEKAKEYLNKIING